MEYIILNHWKDRCTSSEGILRFCFGAS